MRRVVVTGMGLVSPLGVNLETSWRRLIAGESGIGPTTRCDVSDLPCKVAGEVPQSEDENASEKGLLNYNEWMSAKDRRKMGDFIAFGMVAAEQAIQDAGLNPQSEEEKERIGVMVGSGIGGLEEIYQQGLVLAEKGPRRISPFFIPSCLINLASGQISIKYGYKGPNHSVGTACATATHAIGDAARLIMFGDADVMVSGGTESTVCRLGLGGFSALKALSTKYNDTPEAASRPWDEGHDGFVMGEGSGILVLEELEHAQKRGAKIYAEIVGYGMSGDAYHVTSTALDGNGGYRAMRAALKNANLTPADLDYVNAHGTSTPVGDPSEALALKRLMGNELGRVSMSSTKSAIGHLLGAAGGAEAIFSIMAMQDQIAPPTLNLHNPIPEAEGIDLVPLKAKKRTIDVAMSNSFGFGGTNASVIFKRFDS